MKKAFNLRVSPLKIFFVCKRYESCVFSPIKQYGILLEKGILKPDKNQFFVINKLQMLYNEFKSSNFKKVSRSSGDKTVKSFQKGLYLYGEVGTGKTLLLDLFYNSIPISEKKRVHFNMFMLNLYSEINQWNLCYGTDESHFVTPSQHIANKLLSDCWLICFDEVQLADYASSTLLSGVLQHMIDNGAVIVATSNRAPNDLGEASFSNQSNKDKNEPFDIKSTFRNLFEQHCVIHHIDSVCDYRDKMIPGEQRFLYPKSELTDLAFDKMFTELIPKGEKVYSFVLHVYGRKIYVPLCAGNVARFTFNELCCHPLGSADYFKICSSFQSVFIDDIPKMTLFHKNEARRFLSFIDAAYECNVKVYCNSQASVDDIFQMLPKFSDDTQELSNVNYVNGSQMTLDMLDEMAYDLNLTDMILHEFDFLTGQDEIFSFRRAISRLKEMQSALYQKSAHRQMNFLPYSGSPSECNSAYEKRIQREVQRQKKLQEIEESKNLEIVTEHNFKEIDWADEASYKTLSCEVTKKNYMERLEKAPKFNDWHFWGFGWWERLVNKKKNK
ncbi:AFG1-like ATPase isoform X1 [Hydra vulgaris]|uniref:AFG1-like ATPase isoform X1 n=1 Tax=Hydra vulgaris TaxID=6087 RepID=UPI001F5FEC0F|nr:AFG1-like ATPase [Hydra vulgaris]